MSYFYPTAVYTLQCACVAHLILFIDITCFQYWLWYVNKGLNVIWLKGNCGLPLNLEGMNKRFQDSNKCSIKQGTCAPDFTRAAYVKRLLHSRNAQRPRAPPWLNPVWSFIDILKGIGLGFLLTPPMNACFYIVRTVVVPYTCTSREMTRRSKPLLHLNWLPHQRRALLPYRNAHLRSTVFSTANDASPMVKSKSVFLKCSYSS